MNEKWKNITHTLSGMINYSIIHMRLCCMYVHIPADKIVNDISIHENPSVAFPINYIFSQRGDILGLCKR